MNTLWRRVRRIEEELFLLPDGDPPALIRMAGGLPNVLHATIGPNLRLDSMLGESQADFEARALDAATDAGKPFVVVAGLKSTFQ
jgi:hypothetical protein